LFEIIKDAFVGLKTRKYYIVGSWILLTCFVAGQYMIFAHQHHIIKGSTKINNICKKLPRQTVSEKCYLCDVMHHNVMTTTPQAYFNPITSDSYFFKRFEHNFTSVQLNISGGRAPPATGCRS
jgi:hypothetical protein